MHTNKSIFEDHFKNIIEFGDMCVNDAYATNTL